jgi:signal peptidase II
MAERSYRGLLWTLALLGTMLDQVSKYGVFKWLYHDGEGGWYDLIPNVFRLLAQFTGQRETAPGFLAALRTGSGPILPKVNHGALFGIGDKPPHAVFATISSWLGLDPATLANGIFAAVSLLAVVAIAYWSTRRSTTSDWSLSAALGLILAGTMGNLYDRLVFGGVRDFLHFYWFEFPVFNVADSCLVCGAFLLLIQAFWSRPPAPAPENSAVALLPSIPPAPIWANYSEGIDADGSKNPAGKTD